MLGAGVGRQPDPGPHGVERVGHHVALRVQGAPGVGPHHDVGDAGPLGGQVPAVLRGLAHDDIRPPPLDDAAEVVDDVEGQGAGEEVGAGVLVASGTRWDRTELREAHGQVGHRPCGTDGVVVVEAGHGDVGPQRLRHREGHVVAPCRQPAGEGEQREEVADPRERREQHSHHTMVPVRRLQRLETS